MQAERQITIATFLDIIVAIADACARLLDQADGEVGLLRQLHHIEVFLDQCEVYRLNGLLLRDAAPDAGNGREVALGYIYLLAILHGEHLIAVVLQHDD